MRQLTSMVTALLSVTLVLTGCSRDVERGDSARGVVDGSGEHCDVVTDVATAAAKLYT